MMPSSASAAAFKPADLDYRDAAASKMSEDRCDQDLAMEERCPSSVPLRRVGRPGRKRKLLAVAHCDEAKDTVLGPKSHPSAEQVHNGELVGHQGGASSKQDRSAPENSTDRPEGLPDPSSSRRGRPDSSVENGLLGLMDEREQDAERDREQAPPTPRKRRGRRKLEHPEKHVEMREEVSSGAGQMERGDRAKLRGALGWEVSLRQNPMQRIAFQAGDPYYISKRKRDEWLAKWKLENYGRSRGTQSTASSHLIEMRLSWGTTPVS